MIQAIPKLVTFDEFIAWYPEHSECRYELHDGAIVTMPKPTGQHSRVAGFLALKLGMEIERLQLPYFIPKECVLKMPNESGYEPDVIVLDENAIANEPRWERESVITKGSSVRLVIEVVSTNWSDDYALKVEEYEALSIPEYWIADYRGLGGKRYIGTPKKPTFSVYQLIDGEYRVRQFRGSDRIESPAFPELDLTLDRILRLGR
ncbi:Uma2 family endonuclease [Oscillatoriales cyanobacterium LEGE 11467]|uniref:Uma2 family endonuclease n=1 Tax=Zarconia navalis LEGE 11467 TaxID=1828826 RepID=A0A928VZN3_9CYAN|nr:Uma2 family endonuclease [Zarconia navalis]MBE9040605.1 Uma2 family endonuclease [Zarconia navalis LEGE 11467]